MVLPGPRKALKSPFSQIRRGSRSQTVHLTASPLTETSAAPGKEGWQKVLVIHETLSSAGGGGGHPFMLGDAEITFALKLNKY